MNRYYTEQRLNAIEEGRLELPSWQGGVYVPPLQYLKSHHFPSVKGAVTLAPAGRFATPADILGEGSDTPALPPMGLVSPLTAAALALVAFYLFLPTRV
jgi:hypothetical protein